MQALLLVGGEGTRLRPLTCKTVKAMVPILNRPFLEHLFSYLARHGVDDIVLALCYMPDRIESYFGRGDSHGVKLTYVMEESPLGTAGAVKNAERYLQERFFVFNGDIFTDLDLGAMMAFHREREAKATIALTPVEDPSAYGVVETDSDRRVKRFVEKPKREEATTNLINAGTYVLEREVLQGVPPNTRYMFEHHLFPGLLQNDQLVCAYPSDAYWIDIGTPQKYCQVQYDLLQGKGQSSLCSPAKDGRSGFGARSSLHATASVEGAVVVGDDCSIGPHARLRGPVVMGNNCRVLEGAAIEGSVIWNNVTVGRNAWLEGCIVGSNSSIGEGCSVGRGVVIGEGVTVGNGIRLEPGRKVWPDTSV